METSDKNLIIKTEIKQEDDTQSSSNTAVKPYIIDLTKVKKESDDFETGNEDQYLITEKELKSLKSEVDIKSDDGNRTNRKRKRQPNTVECQYCGETFPSNDKLKKHVMDHTGERPFKCQLCPSGFKDKYSLSVHMKGHTGERNFQCPDCDKTFIVSSALKAHARTHSKEKPFVCPVCGRGFSHSANLKPHMAIHSDDHPFHCLECGKSFRTRKGLLTHLRGHHANCKRPNCEFCSQFEKIEVKPRKYVKVPEKIRECPICSQTFKYYMTYKNHMRAHNNENYTCGFCRKSYLARTALRIHLRTHTGETPYACGVCGKKFKRGDSYRYHLSTHSEQRKLFHCDICNQDFTHRSSLLKHKRHVHEDERNFQCSLCERRFKTPQALRGHMHTHRDDNSKLPPPEVCRICGKSIDKRGYKAHMRIHGIDTFKCKKCRGVFEGQEAYNVHVQEGCKRYRSGREDTAIDIVDFPAPEVKVEITVEENGEKIPECDAMENL